MQIDSHCHLDRFAPVERDALLARAAAAGISEVLTIGTMLSDSDQVRAIAREDYPGIKVWCTVGTHPEHVAADTPLPADEIAAMAVAREIVGIGESGLDYIAQSVDRVRQQESFRRHIAAARQSGLPLVIHARGADEDCASILREEQAIGRFGFVLHCFTSGVALAEAGIALGGYVSFSGILTFPKSVPLRDIARSLPADRILVETDAPFLAPVPKRGRANEPAFVVHTAAVLAEQRGWSAAETAERTSDNFKRLFRKAA